MAYSILHKNSKLNATKTLKGKNIETMHEFSKLFDIKQNIKVFKLNVDFE